MLSLHQVTGRTRGAQTVANSARTRSTQLDGLANAGTPSRRLDSLGTALLLTLVGLRSRDIERGGTSPNDAQDGVKRRAI
jgi:hypothetical protein